MTCEIVNQFRSEGRVEGEAIGQVRGEAIGRAEGEAIGRAEGEAIGRAEGAAKGRMDLLLKLVSDGAITAELAAKEAGLSLEAFDGLLETCRETGAGPANPDTQQSR